MFSPPPLERGARSRWKPLPQAEAPTDLWVATGNPQPNERSLGAGPHRRLAPRTNKKHHRHLYIPSRRKKRPRRFLPRPQFSILNSSFSIHSRGVYVFHSGNTPSASLCSAAQSRLPFSAAASVVAFAALPQRLPPATRNSVAAFAAQRFPPGTRSPEIGGALQCGGFTAIRFPSALTANG